MRCAHRTLLCSLALVTYTVAVAPASAEEDDPRLEALERRVEELEQEDPGEDRYSLGPLGEWIKRTRIGGSANTGYYYGGNDSPLDETAFAVWDARFFLGAELADPEEEILLGDVLVLNNAVFFFEWDLVRLGDLENRVGELYAGLSGILGSPWLSAQVGRFQIPLTESYLRYSRGYAEKPFISNSFGPWFWDEGIRFYGSDIEDRFGYVASVSEGDGSFSREDHPDKQVTLKLFARPCNDWLISVSGARTGRLGSSSSTASAALWLGESWARAFGSGTSVPNFIDGKRVTDGPNILSDSYFVGADVVWEPNRWSRLWLSGGAQWIESKDDGGVYDVNLYYWIAELLLGGDALSLMLEPFELGLRAQGLGTYDHDIGYLLDSRYSGTLGYNMESMTAYSAVLGWSVTEWLRLRLEFTHVDLDLVRGVSRRIRHASNDTDSVAVEVGVRF